MKTITFKAKDIPRVGLEMDGLIPETVAGLKISDVAKMNLWAGNKKVKVGDVFEVSGNIAKKADNQKIIIEGANKSVKRVGENMSSGVIEVLGDVGYHLGEHMSGGRITVSGNAGSWIGTCMNDGEIIIAGNAGSYVGASNRGVTEGMRGGRIVVSGNASSEIGVGLHGGEIVIEGSIADFAGSYMNGGALSVGKALGRVAYAASGGEITITDKSYKPPLYFSAKDDEDEFRVYNADISFKGGCTVRIRK